MASIASFISFHREYNQSEARNPLHTSAGCNGQYFKKISRRRLRPPHFPLKKEKGGLSARQNFSFFQNFQMQVCKQYYKNRVNIHSNFLEVSDVKKSNTKRNQTDKLIRNFSVETNKTKPVLAGYSCYSCTLKQKA